MEGFNGCQNFCGNFHLERIHLFIERQCCSHQTRVILIEVFYSFLLDGKSFPGPWLPHTSFSRQFKHLTLLLTASVTDSSTTVGWLGLIPFLILSSLSFSFVYFSFFFFFSFSCISFLLFLLSFSSSPFLSMPVTFSPYLFLPFYLLSLSVFSSPPCTFSLFFAFYLSVIFQTFLSLYLSLSSFLLFHLSFLPFSLFSFSFLPSYITLYFRSFYLSLSLLFFSFAPSCSKQSKCIILYYFPMMKIQRSLHSV